MHGEDFFFQSFVYLAAAVISVPVAKRLGLGSVLGYLMAGFLIGPHGLELIGEGGQDVLHFAEFGVVMMLFLIGLELQPSMLWRLRGPILGLGGLQVAATSLAIALPGALLGLSFQTALAVGMILSLSSTAIVLQSLSEKGLLRTDAGQSSFSVLLFQDIAVIPMLAVMPLLALGASGSGGRTSPAPATAADWVEALPGWAHALVVLGVILAIVLAGLFLVRPVLRAIARTRLREVFTAAALLLVVGAALLMTRIGVSPALGTFLAGVVLANSEYRHELEGDIEPFKGLLLGLFFVSVGASLDFHLIASRPGLIAALVAGLVLIKFVVVLALGRAFKMGTDQNLLFALSLAQGGEFAFVLLSYAVQNRVMPAETANPLVGAVALSMFLTPVLLLFNEKVLQPRFGTRELQQQREADAIDVQNPVIIAGFGGFGSIIGRLLRANGVGVTVLELDSDKVDLLRMLGLKVFYGDASRRDLLHAAGADQARVLILAVYDPERTIQIVNTAKKHFPHLLLFARAGDRTEAYELLDAGVHKVYRETLDTSLRAGVDALRELGFRSYQAHRASMTFRQHDEHAFAELRQLRHNHKDYISQARRKIEDLEELLLSELQDAAEHPDVGWDSEAYEEERDATGKAGGARPTGS